MSSISLTTCVCWIHGLEWKRNAPSECIAFTSRVYVEKQHALRAAYSKHASISCQTNWLRKIFASHFILRGLCGVCVCVNEKGAKCQCLASALGMNEYHAFQYKKNITKYPLTIHNLYLNRYCFCLGWFLKLKYIIRVLSSSASEIAHNSIRIHIIHYISLSNI